MLEGLDEAKLDTIRTSTKAGCIAGLAEAISTWNRIALDGLPVRTPLEQLMDRYSYHMDRLTQLDEQDRVAVLEAFARAGRLRENKTTGAQSRYVGQVKRDVQDLDALHPARHFMDPIIASNGPACDFSPETTIYIASHMALGLRLPRYFLGISSRMKEYLLDPENQALSVDQKGVILLGPFIRIHAMFLEAPSEAVEEEKSLVEIVAVEEDEDTPFMFDEEENAIEDEHMEGFQKIKRVKGYEN